MTEWIDLNEGRRARSCGIHVACSEAPNPESRIPDSSRLWWKAQLLKRWEAERRAQWPLDVMQPIEIAGGLVAAGLLVYWSLPYLL